MTGPTARRGFLRGLASLPLIGGGVAVPAHAAIAAARDPDTDLIKAGETWREAITSVSEARSRLFAGKRLYREAVGLCPPELGLSWEDRCQYLKAVGLPPGTISSGGRRPMPDWDPGLLPMKVDAWGTEVHTGKTLRAAISMAPGNLGPAGRTPMLIRGWRALLPVADVRDQVRKAARRMACLEHLHDELKAAEKAVDVAAEAVRALPALGLVGIVIKARFGEFEMAEYHDPERARVGQRQSVMEVFDAVLAMGGDTFPMPADVRRYDT